MTDMQTLMKQLKKKDNKVILQNQEDIRTKQQAWIMKDTKDQLKKVYKKELSKCQEEFFNGKITKMILQNKI